MNRVKIFIMCFFWGGWTLNAQQCFPDGLLLESQGQVDSFSIQYPGCSVIEGNLEIRGYGISDLSGLSALTEVKGNLSVLGTTIQHFTGLNQLQNVGNSLIISQNNFLNNFDGLGALMHVGAHLGVQFNTHLTSFEGAGQLQNIGGGMLIIGNTQLQHLHGLSSLDSIHAWLSIATNNNMLDFDGLQSLKAVTGYVEILDCPRLKALNGLDGLRYIGTAMSVVTNDSLENITALANLEYVGSYVELLDNPRLSYCSIPSFCRFVGYGVPSILFENNAEGCNNVEDVGQNCVGGYPVVATIWVDANGNCQRDDPDYPVPEVNVGLSVGGQFYIKSADESGQVYFNVLDTGLFVLTLPGYPLLSAELCTDSFSIHSDTILGTVFRDFLLQPLNACAQLVTEIHLPPSIKPMGLETPVSVSCKNIGGINAEAVRLAVVLPPGVELVAFSNNFTQLLDDTMIYELNVLHPFQEKTEQFILRLSPDVEANGQTLCFESYAGMADNCNEALPPYSEIRLFSECLNDTTVRFYIKNIGNAPTQNYHEYIIIEDEIVLRMMPFDLDPGEIMTVEVPANGSVYRMEATRNEEGEKVAVAIEGCGGFTPGLITAFWLNNSLSDYDFDCREVLPPPGTSQKNAIPKGVGADHIIPENTLLQYTISFKNEYSFPVSRVTLKEALSPSLDLTSVSGVRASYPLTWSLVNDTLQVTLLPKAPGNVILNDAWVTFEVYTRPDVVAGDVVESSTWVQFNEMPLLEVPQIYHTIGALSVDASEAISDMSQSTEWTVVAFPGCEQVQLYQKQPDSQKKEVMLFDWTGRLQSLQRFSGDNWTLPVGTLPKGGYVIRLVSEDGTTFTFKIMI